MFLFPVPVACARYIFFFLGGVRYSRYRYCKNTYLYRVCGSFLFKSYSGYDKNGSDIHSASAKCVNKLTWLTAVYCGFYHFFVLHLIVILLFSSVSRRWVRTLRRRRGVWRVPRPSGWAMSWSSGRRRHPGCPWGMKIVTLACHCWRCRLRAFEILPTRKPVPVR